jgi:hypothetical protein
MSNIDELNKLISAVEEKRKKEDERLAAETARLSCEKERLRLEKENTNLIRRMVRDVTDLINIVDKHTTRDFNMLNEKIEHILALVQVVALKVGGTDLARLVDEIRSGSMVSIKMGDGSSIENVVEGIQNINPDQQKTVESLLELIKSDDVEKTEVVVNSLPGDIVDVVVESIKSPLAAAGMIAKKVLNKWRIQRAA